MSKLHLVQVGSNPFHPSPMWPTFQTFNNTTVLQAYPVSLAKPVTTLSGISGNPIGVYDNTKERMVNLLLMFAGTTTSNQQMAVDVTGFSNIPGTSLYLPTRFFLGEVQLSTYSIAAQGTASSLLCDQFDLKTFAAGTVGYIEPADDSSGALMVIDIRGYDLVGIRLAAGGTAATAGQVFWGVN